MAAVANAGNKTPQEWFTSEAKETAGSLIHFAKQLPEINGIGINQAGYFKMTFERVNVGHASHPDAELNEDLKSVTVQVEKVVTGRFNKQTSAVEFTSGISVTKRFSGRKPNLSVNLKSVKASPDGENFIIGVKKLLFRKEGEVALQDVIMTHVNWERG